MAQLLPQGFAQFVDPVRPCQILGQDPAVPSVHLESAPFSPYGCPYFRHLNSRIIEPINRLERTCCLDNPILWLEGTSLSDKDPDTAPFFFH